MVRGFCSLSEQVCQNHVAGEGVSLIKTGMVKPGLTLCIRTSDGRVGTVSVTQVTHDALGGWISGTSTIWY
ncbi:hypothetical protein Plo01_77500 [Planobispora longispora]|uniref:Uncharacterized protein n=1 Tax=Planobispora longispora TaxID=28887 RepID=A0A8J3RWD6_9ACTN|nr:hypothetical protein GCM10020093_023510 [Planobispora longispora]GIH81321.1 hypothetical protein Plo01_77500 [Planobispora longispora]